MEEAPENGKKSPHSAHANGLIEHSTVCVQWQVIQYAINIYNNHTNRSHFSMFLPHTYFRHMIFSNEIHANSCMSI
jgi:hypothetical protein